MNLTLFFRLFTSLGISLCLFSSTLKATEEKDSQNITLATLIGQNHQFCLISEAEQSTQLECKTLQDWLKSDCSLSPEKPDYLKECPEELAREGKCKTASFSQQDLENSHPQQLCRNLLVQMRNQTQDINHEPSVFYQLWEELILTHINEGDYFLDHSLDDLFEDLMALGASTLIGFALIKLSLPLPFVILVTLLVHPYISHLADRISNLVEVEPEHEHTDSYSAIAVSNLVENGVKSLYYVYKLSGMISVQIIYSYLNIPQTALLQRPVSLRQKAIYCFVALESVKELASCISNYNWINNRSDQLGDYAKASFKSYEPSIYYYLGLPSELLSYLWPTTDEEL